MLAFLGSTIGKYVIIGLFALLLFGGAALYVKFTSDQMALLEQKVAALTVEAQSLKVANESMKQDITNVQTAQADAWNKLEDIRTSADVLSNQIRNQIVTSSNPAALEKSVNENTAALLKGLEDLSAATRPTK